MRKFAVLAVCAGILVTSSNAMSLKISFFQPQTSADQNQLNTFNFTASTVADPEDVARDFIASQKQALGYFSTFASDGYDTEDLEVEKVDSRENTTHVVFRQTLEDVPVFGQKLKVHLRSNQSVLLMNGQYVNLEEADVQNIVVIKPDQAISLAMNSLGFRSDVENKVEETYIPHEDNLIFGYKVTTLAGKYGEFVSLVNAKDGKILKQYNQVLHPSGQENPKSFNKLKKKYKDLLRQVKAEALNSAPSALVSTNTTATIEGPQGTVHSASIKTDPQAQKVVLKNLDDTGHLQGKSVVVMNGKEERAKDENKKFHFEPESTHYHEVMAYYHIQEFIDYLKGLGVDFGEKPIQATVHHNDDDNSFYSPDKKQLFFGDGGVPDSADADIILHEFGHAVVDRLAGLQGGWGTQAGAMHEGFGDYIASTFFGDPNVGEWDSSAYSEDGYLRTLANRKVFPQDLTQSIHEDGEIWGGVLWDLRKELGKEAADSLIFHSLSFLPEKATFKDGLIAILSVDETRFKGKYKAKIQRNFFRRGIKVADPKVAAQHKSTFEGLYSDSQAQ